MSPIFLTAYVLAFPVVVACVLLYLVRAFHSDWLQAKAENRPMI